MISIFDKKYQFLAKTPPSSISSHPSPSPPLPPPLHHPIHPLQPYGAHPARIAPAREDILGVDDSLDAAAEEHAGRMNRDGVVAEEGAVASVGTEPRGVGEETLEEGLEDGGWGWGWGWGRGWGGGGGKG